MVNDYGQTMASGPAFEFPGAASLRFLKGAGFDVVPRYLPSPPLADKCEAWGLQELSDRMKLKREDRRVVGKAFRELLELLHSMRATPSLLADLRKRGTIPPELEAFLRAFYSNIAAKLMVGFPERYNAAIDSISGRLPLLPFELCSKNQLDVLLGEIRPLAALDPRASVILPVFEDAAREELLTRLDDLVNRRAWLHGWKTWLRLRLRSRKPDETSAKIDSLLLKAGIPLKLP
jgi:hypothetical protein